MIILLDGSKGAGKSSTSEVLVHRLPNTVHLSIDTERRALLYQDRNIDEKNKEAFEIMLSKTKDLIIDDKNVVIDCGLTPERILMLEKVAQEANTLIHKFFLKASYDTQLARVRERDKSRGKESTDVNRFDVIHKRIHSKALDEFSIIETDTTTPDEVASLILSKI